MQRTIIDYAITALNVLYWAALVIWGWFLLTTDLATKNNMWIVLPIFAVMIPYHLLRRKRDRIRSRSLQRTP